MYLYLSVITVIGIAFILFIWAFTAGASGRKGLKIHDASLTCEELEEHAKEIACDHVVSTNKNLSGWPIPRMNENYSFILSVYKALNEDVRKKRTIPPSAEWLLDNFYIIEEQIKGIRRDLTKEEYARLPVLTCGHMKGYARTYAIAAELVAHTDGQLDERILLNYIKAYQSHTTLLDRELWAMPVMLRLALVENIRFLCEKIKNTQALWRDADELADSVLDDEEQDTSKLLKVLEGRIKALEEVNPSFVEHLSYRLRRAGRIFTHATGIIDEKLAKHGTSISAITQKEHNTQAVNAVSIGNCIISLKFISLLDWVDVFESTSHVEQILNQDPDGTYPLMDLPSRNQYRKKVEELASAFKVSEVHVAREAVNLARSAANSGQQGGHACHTGYYLVGKGLEELEKKSGFRPTGPKRILRSLKKHPAPLYMGSILLISLLLAVLAGLYTFHAAMSHRILLALLAGIVVLTPASDIAVTLVNWLVCKGFKPVFFPRLELKSGIPEGLTGMVVIPALLPDAKRVKELLENLETHYLANKEENLYFALAGDFKDAAGSTLPGDDEIVNTALEGVRELNHKYSADGREIFYYFHRHRQFNERQKKWMGWERKRGALAEFNRLLLGAKDTSYSISSGGTLPPIPIKYVITLDADTVLPMGAAKKMVGTMAHPLNRPVIDEKRGIVVEGYGLIQPKIVFDVESSNKTLFSRIFTGQEGIDPYACAISDVYQDLFGEGIYTGKGIYDLAVFERVLENAIPENTVLSHDLLEGSYVRTGLVTDIELVDGYPARYNSYADRMHRWVRGDWQILPWLGGTVKNRQGQPVKNPLSAVSRWKILDNLRRSLTAPALIRLLLLGFTLLPGSLLWLGFSVLTLGFSFITALIDYLYSWRPGAQRVKRHMQVISGLKASGLQILLLFLFLPYQAYLMADAIVVTLVRVLVTRKNMLEWVTAADTERVQKNSLRGFWRKMRVSSLEGLILLLLAAAVRPDQIYIAVLLFIVWSASPLAAYHISKVKEAAAEPLSPEDSLELRRIARKTWRYFEEFMNFKNHYLPPDNYQEDPPNGVAYRTSPTNIGLGMLCALTARDLGFIGTREMAEFIGNTVSTLEKAEKWNGHLYNWYDTRTLRPLRPRYISTVDSGNFVCYLVTLVQGMGEYLDRPLADPRFVDGINDILSFIGQEEIRNAPAMELLRQAASEKPFDLLLWHRGLEELSALLRQTQPQPQEKGTRKSRWRAKGERMIDMLRKELSEFFPWLGLLENLPPELEKEPLEDIFSQLDGSTPLKDLPEAYQNVLASIDGNPASARLGELRAMMAKGLENTEQFIHRYNGLVEKIRSIADATEFKPLYVEKKQLFSIGYNIEENRLTNSYYDLLASEARQTSYLAIARGEVPPRHWFKLGRALTVVDRYKGLVSWTGTMFEYLMPLLIMRSYKNTLLDETYSFVIRSQKKYGRQRHVPWGNSESGFYSLDVNLDYQYKAIGVPWLGLKRGLVEDIVVAPYATFLALPADPAGAMENIKRLRDEGLDGPYGFYEAIDYTPERMPFGLKRAIVKSFMAHHQGMSLLALNNQLNGNIMQRRFHADPVIKAAGLLLQEKVPTNLVLTKETQEKITPFKAVVYKEKGVARRFKQPDPVLPRVHVLSNGSHSVMITERGTGYSKNRMAAITRWREDIALDSYGMFFYLRNTDTGRIWSAAYAPCNTMPERYEAVFTSDKAQFKRLDENIETLTDIVVTSGDNAEIRRISLKNRGGAPQVLEVTSYFEVVLAAQNADIAHPAFSNLFVRTEFVPEYKSLLANRRPRSESDKSLWLANTTVVEGEIVGDVEYETDRMQFIGRGRTVSNPEAMERGKPLSNSSGPVLDPVMCLRLRVRLQPGQTARISYIVSVSESRDSAMELIGRYSAPEAVESAFRLALTRSQVEARYLNIKAPELELYQEALSHIVFAGPLRRMVQEFITRNRKGQSSLWAYGISGDLPIVLAVLKKQDELDILYEILKAHEYWRLKDIRADLVILDEEEGGYTHPLYALLKDILSSGSAHEFINRPGGVFILNRNSMPEEDVTLIYAAARVVLRGDGGSLSDQIKLQRSSPLPGGSTETGSGHPPLLGTAAAPALHPSPAELQYFNGLGGFSPDGREYVIRLEQGQHTPLPWANVVCNPHFGFIVTESGSGYTWCENSRENKLSPWSNDPVGDMPGEIIYLGEGAAGDQWTITPLPVREGEPYVATHGFGYSSFAHTSRGIEQRLVQFVPVADPVKVSLVTLKNLSGVPRDLSLAYYVRPVLGVSDQMTAMHIVTSLHGSGALLAENPYNEEFPGRVMFMDVSEEGRQVTGDRREFFGKSGPANPQGLRNRKLSGTVGAGYDPCAAMQTGLHLEPGEERTLVFLLGMAKSADEITGITARYKNPGEARKALDQARDFWNEKLGMVQVDTPDATANIMLNGWLMYQVVACRMWARSAFYQSGGAYGFRDQLQDSLAIAHVWPEAARSQILLHARHQFVEGDVQHWWHEPKGKGTRTRFSDDLLWLPYVTAEYIRISGDTKILETRLPFLEDEPLKEFEDERYSTPVISIEKDSLYDHCVRAIERALRFGEHGIPLMGSGDWNDGMNTVGNRGKGESVWLGWFLYSTLMSFAPLCKGMKDTARGKKYTDAAKKIADAIEEKAWDGRWYRRAYFDNGLPLGSIQNSECKIDSISQSWAVISEGGRRERTKEAMNSVENYLVQRDEGLIKLLTPPFDEGDLEPGYIKGYVPGVRENGGQYTHAAAWVVIAFAKMGEGDKACELFDLINPINHTRTHIEYSKYKVEPYVMAADVYAVDPHTGRGGWTWYTGSASWIYRAGLEYILGFRKIGSTLVIDPCIPRKWGDYRMKYRYMDSLYEIRVKNSEGVSRGVKCTSVDGRVLQSNAIQLVNDRKTHHVEVVLGR